MNALTDPRATAAVFAAISGRRSTRALLPDAIEPETIDRLLQAATAAPSAHNRQPWRFALLRTRTRRAALAEAMGRRLEADRTRDGDDPNSIRRDVARSALRITTAPAVVLACLSLEDMDSYADERRSRAEWIMAVQSTAMAVQNLLLAAHTEGLGACIMCAPLFCGETVRAALGLPDAWQPQMLVTLGRPAKEAAVRPRRPLASVVLDMDAAP